VLVGTRKDELSAGPVPAVHGTQVDKDIADVAKASKDDDDDEDDDDDDLYDDDGAKQAPAGLREEVQAVGGQHAAIDGVFLPFNHCMLQDAARPGSCPSVSASVATSTIAMHYALCGCILLRPLQGKGRHTCFSK
jgi:hypothetical protein